MKTFRRAVCGGTGKGLTSELRGFREGGGEGPNCRLFLVSLFSLASLGGYFSVRACVRACWMMKQQKQEH